MTSINQAPKDIPIYVTPKKLAAEMGLPMGGLRHWLFHRETNGLSPVVFQIGRKLLISKSGFMLWIASHNKTVGGQA